MLATLPLEAFVCRSVMITFYFPGEPYNPNRHLIFTTSLVVTSVIIALITCDLGVVFELIGATSACALAYILPPLCYIKLSQRSWKSKIPAVLCIVFGTAVLSVSIIQAVVKIIKRTSPLEAVQLGRTKANNFCVLNLQTKAELKRAKLASKAIPAICIIIRI